MSGKQFSTNEVSVDEQGLERVEDISADEDGFEVVDEQSEFRPTVEQETQAKVDANHPEGITEEGPDHLYGQTLAQEERIRARETELERISAQADLGTQDGRAKRTRQVVVEQRRQQRWKRTPASTEAPDPREELSQEELAEVNQAAHRIAAEVQGGYSRAVISAVLANRVSAGEDLTSAVLNVLEEQKTVPGVVIPIADVPDVPVGEVSVEGSIQTLWEPSSPKIAQVGLIADESGKIKFTSWRKSDQKWVSEGEQIRLKYGKKNWYQGRCSLALTYDSRITYPERDRRWWKD